VWFGLLGPLVVNDDNGDERVLAAVRLRVLLAALLLGANQPVPAGELAEAVWNGRPPRGHVATLRSYVMRLRQTLGGEFAPRLVTRQPGYLIRLDESELDVLAFEALHHRSAAALRVGRWAEASDAAARALALWRATPLLDVPSQVLHAGWLPRLEQLRAQVDEWRIEAELQLGHHQQIIPELRDLTERYPLRENVHLALMRALARSGQRAQALEAYQQARRILVDELGIEPGAELRALQQRILDGDSDGASVPAASDAPPSLATTAVHQLPTAIRHFAGRRNELNILSALLDEPPPAPGAVVIVVISGTAGIGKTTLGVYWAHLIAARFPDGQLHANLRGFAPSGTAVSPAEAVRGFLDALGVSPQRIPTDLGGQIALYRSLLADRRMLLLLDNAQDAQQVRPLLPGSPGCLVIVTSRSNLASLVAVEAAHPLELDLPPLAEARELLARRLGSGRVAREPQAIDRIVDRCGRLPLALAIAAARAAARPAFPLASLAAELDQADGLDEWDTDDPASDLRSVFSWSYRMLPPDAARLFRALALHPGPDISVPACSSLLGESPRSTRALLTHLARAHLVNEYLPGRYSLHDLLRAYATELASAIDTEDDRRATRTRMFDHYLHTANRAALLLEPKRDRIQLLPAHPQTIPERLADVASARAWLTSENRVLVALITYAAKVGFDAYVWRLAWSTARFLHWQGHWQDWIETQTMAVEAAQRLADPQAEATARRGLSHVHMRLHHDDQALEQVHAALRLFEQLNDQANQGQTHLNAAHLLDRLGRYPEALEHVRRAMHLLRASGNTVGEINCLNAFGWLQAKTGHYHEALATCEEALTLVGHADDPRLEAAILDSLGHIHQCLGRYQQTVGCYERAVGLRRQIGDRAAEAATLVRLGDSHQAAGDAEATRNAWQEALQILTAIEHPDADAVRAKLDELN
jgi:DNA-binding SARP family transcriptional activator/Tfp pilus assembly protein PilF